MSNSSQLVNVFFADAPEVAPSQALVPGGPSDLIGSINVIEEQSRTTIDGLKDMTDEEIVATAQSAHALQKHLDTLIIECALEIRRRVAARPGVRDRDGSGLQAQIDKFASEVGIHPSMLRKLMAAYTSCFPEGVRPEDVPRVEALPRDAFIVAGRAPNPQEAISEAMERAGEPGFSTAALGFQIDTNARELELAEAEGRRPIEYKCLTLKLPENVFDLLHKIAGDRGDTVHDVAAAAIVTCAHILSERLGYEPAWVPIPENDLPFWEQCLNHANKNLEDNGPEWSLGELIGAVGKDRARKIGGRSGCP